MNPHVICTALGVAPYKASDATCLSVQEGRYYAITKQGDPSWWCARLIGLDGGITDKIGLIPADHVRVIGSGYIPQAIATPIDQLSSGGEGGEGGGGGKDDKGKKKKKKKSRIKHASAVNVSGEEETVAVTTSSPSTAEEPITAAEAVADQGADTSKAKAYSSAAGSSEVERIVAEKDACIEALQAELQALRGELVQMMMFQLPPQLAQPPPPPVVVAPAPEATTCPHCGRDLHEKTRDLGAREEGEPDNDADLAGIDALVASGVAPRETLLKLKMIVRSCIVRRRFRAVAMDFKGHKASLVMRLRNESLREIYTSERKYVDSLMVCLHQFFHPFMHNASGPVRQRIITRGQIAEMFHSLDLIVDLNKSLLDDLKARLDQWPSIQKFGDLFVRMAPIFRLYSGYVRNFDTAQRVVTQLRENAAFAEFVRECETKAGGGLTLESYLIMPVQRLPRYQMLLDGLLKYTIETHVDYVDLKHAKDAVVKILNEINLQKKLDETYMAVRLLAPEVEGLTESLRSTAFLINRGSLHSMMGANFDAFHYILFDDLLLKCRDSKSKKHPHGLIIQEALPVVRVVEAKDIPDMEGIRNGVELVLIALKKGDGNQIAEREVRLGLCAPTPADKAQWIKNVASYHSMVLMGEEFGLTIKLQEACARVKEELMVGSSTSSPRDMRRSLSRLSSRSSVSKLPSSPSLQQPK